MNSYLIKAWIDTINNQIKMYSNNIVILFDTEDDYSYSKITFDNEHLKCDDEVLLNPNEYNNMTYEEIDKYFKKFELRLCIQLQPPILDTFVDILIKCINNGILKIGLDKFPKHLQDKYKNIIDILKMGSQLNFKTDTYFCDICIDSDNELQIIKYGKI